MTASLCSIVVTGRGIVSAIGASMEEFEARLSAAQGGIARHHDIFADQAIYAGLAVPFETVPGLDQAAPNGADRTARMAAAALVQALREARLWDGAGLALSSDRIALLVGSSHGGRSQLDRFVETGMDVDDLDSARGVMERAAHHHQAAVLGTLFGFHGPVVTVSTACSSSGIAIAHGVELLRSGRVDAVVAGGADAFSKLTFAGFKALGAMADGPCGPFGSIIGMTLGEGAAFVVLERQNTALARGARPWAEILGWGTSWDAHHLTTPEPSGDGMRRAIGDALARSGMTIDRVDYISAHGTGTRANDISETLAIKRSFEAAPIPPVSATKSFTGHTLGASSAIGLLAGLSTMSAIRLPPTLNLRTGRAGCDLDYVPQTARAARVTCFLALSAAFGGVNCAILGGRVGAPRVPVPACEDAIVVTGLGVISPLGCSPSISFDAVLAGRSAGAVSERSSSSSGAPEIAVVDGFDPRRHLPGGRAPRINRITQYAVAAIEQALVDAGWPASRRRSTRIGLMVGLSRGAAGNFDAFLASVRGSHWSKASPTAFPHLVMSSVGGQAAIALGLKGTASTIVGGADVGLTLLATAAECLRRRLELDAIVVVAADELTPLHLRLDVTRRGETPLLPRAEGATALVLERRRPARDRSAPLRAEIAGWAQSFDAVPGPALDDDGIWLEQAIRAALDAAGSKPEQVDVVLTMARAEPRYDRREASTLKRVFGAATPPISALGGHTGFAEAMSGLYAVSMAILALETGCLPAPGGRLSGSLGMPWLTAPASGRFFEAVVAGSSDFGCNGAVVLRRGARRS